jgi:hypothetical protein
VNSRPPGLFICCEAANMAPPLAFTLPMARSCAASSSPSRPARGRRR